jgi:cyanate permease
MPGFRPPRPRRPPWTRAAVVAVLVFVLWAESDGAGFAVAPDLLAVNSIDQTISNITAWIVGILAGLATMFLTIGGLRYLMAGGEPGEVEKAKGALKSAGIGYMLAVMAPIIVGVLKGLVGA